MKTICAWCKKIITDGPEEVASHGICEACDAREFPVTDAENSVCFASKAAFHVTYSRGKFDSALHFLASSMVHAAIYSADPCRINRIAELLDVDPQRCRRMIDALGLSADYLAAKEAGRGIK